MFGALIDLHLHLDGSISLESARQLAAMQNMPELSKEQIRSVMVAGRDCHSLNDFLKKFAYPCSLLQTEATITKSINNLLHELRDDGLIYVEIRFAPQLSMRGGLSMQQVVEAAVAGLDDKVLPANLIVSLMRGTHDEVYELNKQTLEIAKQYLGQGVVAADLAGSEAKYSTQDYEELFAYARQLGVPFVLHAGESEYVKGAGAKSVLDAISMGAVRIGHGILGLKDPNVLSELASHNISLEICPSSNVCTNIINTITDLPFETLQKAGVKYSINTDDMVIIGTTLRKEYEILSQSFNITPHQVASLLLTAVDVSFASEELKQSLRHQIKEYYGCE